MKTFALTFTLALLFACFSQAETIRIGDQVFVLADSKQSNEGTMKEYVPREQSLQNWKRLVAVRHFHNLKSPKKYIDNLVSEYRKRYPHMKFEAGGDKARNQWLVDYIIYPRDGGPKFVEWNFFTARPSSDRGIIVYQYAARASYEKSVEEAFKALDVPNLRREMLPVLRRSEFWQP